MYCELCAAVDAGHRYFSEVDVRSIEWWREAEKQVTVHVSGRPGGEKSGVHVCSLFMD